MDKSLEQQVQFVLNNEGVPVSVIVPIEVWHSLASEKETSHLLKSNAMTKRLRSARKRTTSVSLEDVRAKLGI